MKLFKLLNQPDMKTCLHTCLAMITGESVEYVIAWLDNEYALNAEDAIIFLAHHGIYLAAYTRAEDGETLPLSEIGTLKLAFDMGRAALLTVKSKHQEGKLHAIFWTGQEVLDPMVISPCELADYDIIEFWPMLVTEQRQAGFEESKVAA